MDKKDLLNRYHFQEHPAELKKKVSLFGHFKGYLYGQGENNFPGETPPE